MNYNPTRSTKIRSPRDLRKTIATLQVPKTPGDNLAKQLRKTETKLRAVSTTKVKILERVGCTLRATLVKSDPWGGEPCHDLNCHPCKTEDMKVSCRRRNVCYTNQCLKCKATGVNTTYIGESSNSLRERMQQHCEDFSDSSKESHMRQHLEYAHGGGTVEHLTILVVKY